MPSQFLQQKKPQKQELLLPILRLRFYDLYAPRSHNSPVPTEIRKR